MSKGSIYTIILAIFSLSAFNVNYQTRNIENYMKVLGSNNFELCNQNDSFLIFNYHLRHSGDSIYLRKVLSDFHVENIYYIAYFQYTTRPKRFYRIYYGEKSKLKICHISIILRNNMEIYQLCRVKDKPGELFSFDHVKQRQLHKCAYSYGDIMTTDGGNGLVFDFINFKGGDTTQNRIVLFKW